MNIHEPEGDFRPLPSIDKTGAVHVGEVAMRLGDLKRKWGVMEPKARIRIMRGCWQMLRELERMAAEEVGK